VEEIDDGAFVDQGGSPTIRSASVNGAWFDQVVNRFDLHHHSSLIHAGEVIAGGLECDPRDLMREADLLVNISGNLRTADLLFANRRRVYVDLDPGFTQLWWANGECADRPEDHHGWVTVGSNVGTTRCALPVSGIPWRHVPPPVVLDDWPVTSGGQVGAADFRGFNTVTSWRGPFGPVEWEGRWLGGKVHEFRKYLGVPSTVSADFELAVAIHPADSADLEQLTTHGWTVADPVSAAGTPDAFQRYVQRAGAEFSVAQSVYVGTTCGWFSDRSTRYLASGRPVLVQDTGFSDRLPTSEGLNAYRTIDEAVIGARRIIEDYEFHSAAARRIAEEYFDSDQILSGFLEDFLA
jgi:hypothetical protein